MTLITHRLTGRLQKKNKNRLCKGIRRTSEDMKNQHPHTHCSEHYTTPWHEHTNITTPRSFILLSLHGHNAIILLNALNNSYWSVGTWGQEEEHLTAKLQRSLLKLHSFPVTAGEEKGWSQDTKETEGVAITLLLGLINNKLMQQCKENTDGAQFGITSRHVELLNWAQETCYAANCVKQMHFTCLCACSRHVLLILEPEAAIRLVSERTGLLVTETQSVSHSGRRESPLP